MPMKTLTLAAALTLALSGAAMAQKAAGGGSAEGNKNNLGGVKSDSEKSIEGGSASIGTGTGPGASSGAAPSGE